MGLLAKTFACCILLSLVAAGFASYCEDDLSFCPRLSDGKYFSRCCTVLDKNGASTPGCCLDIGTIAGPVVGFTVVATFIALIGVCMCCRCCPCCECCKRTWCYKKEIVVDRERDGCPGIKIIDRKLGGEEEKIDPNEHGSYDAEKPLIHQVKA